MAVGFVFVPLYFVEQGISPEITSIIIGMALLPSIYYPLHFLTKGGWGSFDNIMKIWPFQLTVNGLCLLLNFFIFSQQHPGSDV